jgi:nucleoid DNA-binding protein
MTNHHRNLQRMRVAVDYNTSREVNYKNFCKSHPSIKISFDQWKQVIYTFNELFMEHILETGDNVKLPFGFGELTINKKKRKKITIDRLGNEHINLPVDWIKTREKGKLIYNFNYHTEGYFFGWLWFIGTARFKNADVWRFKPSRASSRLLSHYLKIDSKYQHIYKEWKY